MCRHASERGDLRVALVGPSEQADRADTEVARLTIIPYGSCTEVDKLRLRTNNWILRRLILILMVIMILILIRILILILILIMILILILILIMILKLIMRWSN